MVFQSSELERERVLERALVPELVPEWAPELVPEWALGLVLEQVQVLERGQEMASGPG
jgi:hypothetical protein